MSAPEVKLYVAIAIMIAIHICFAVYARINHWGKEQNNRVMKYLTPLSVIFIVCVFFYPIIPVWITAPIALLIGLFAAWGGRGYTELIYRRYERLKEQENAGIDEKSADNKNVEA